jgi:hypothetical protein
MADRAEPTLPQEPADISRAAVHSDAEVRSTSEISGPMLDLHAPHESIHTLKSFLIHIAAIVVGLIIAVGLEQAVELVHHRHQVAVTREALRLERDSNRKNFVDDSRVWRWENAELQNNLLVLKYLQEHPRTPQEALPGILRWGLLNAGYDRASWEAANQTGITILMPRQEVAEAANLYSNLQRVSDMGANTWLAVNDAERYTLLDSDPSHLSIAAIGEEITLTENALTKLFIKGVALQNLHANHPDFPEVITREELDRLRNRADQPKVEQMAPARALTEARLKAAGWDPSIRPGHDAAR